MAILHSASALSVSCSEATRLGQVRAVRGVAGPVLAAALRLSGLILRECGSPAGSARLPAWPQFPLC